MYACSQAADLSDAYVDGELPASVRAQVLRHLRTCAECAASIEQIVGLKSLVRRSVRSLAVPLSLRHNLRIRMGV